LRLDVAQAEAFAYKINAGKFLNTLQILLAMMITPSATLAEDMVYIAEELFIEVLINEQPEGVVFLLRRDDRLLLRSKDLRRWRFRLPDTKPITFDGEDFHALNKFVGLAYKFDEFTQTLTVEAPPSLFDTTEIKGRVADFVLPTPSTLGGYINYDVLANSGQGQTTTNGQLELGGFGSWGAGQTRIVGQDLGGQADVIRLDTTLTRDKVMQMASLRFGDTISGISNWGGAVRLGGVQWATNFSTQPDFISFKLPQMSGEAALPSTLDLYDNNILRMSFEVPSGPFSIEDIPLMTGQGDARLVVRDILGREQIITQPYYIIPKLLKQGLQDYSYELGFVRKNFGTDSNNYGLPVAVGTHRYGITEQFTGELHGELLVHQQALGMGYDLLVPGAGMLSGSFAMSKSKKGVGSLLKMGFNRQSRNFSFGANTQLTSKRFVKLGQKLEEYAPLQESRMFATLATIEHGTFSASLTHQSLHNRNGSKMLMGTYSKGLKSMGNLNLSMNRYLSGDEKTSFTLNFSMPLGKRINSNIYRSTWKGRKHTNIQLSRDKPQGNGVGYSLIAGLGDSEHRELKVSLQNGVGNYSLASGKSQGQTVFRGGASGGVAFLGGNSFFSRRISDSFAVVQVPDYSGVGIYMDNKIVGRTDANGNALIPSLRSYEKNSVRIEQADLPLDSQIDTLELDAVPYFRSGLILKFPVKSSRAALLTVVLENGEPLPAGAQVQNIGDNAGESEIFPTGMRGEVYLTGLAANNRVKVTWREQTCEFVLPFPKTTDPLPHLGTYICRGVGP